MKLIHQHPESGLCVACCLAMVTGTDTNYVLARVHLRVDGTCPRPYVPMREAIKFLFDHDLSYGSPFVFAEAMRTDRGVNSLVSRSIELTQVHNALLSVRSTRIEGHLHMVVWNAGTHEVYDPQEIHPRELADYAIVEWANLVPLSEL